MKNSYTWNLLIALDQLFNVLLSPLLNALVRNGGARFGYADETLSSVFGKNHRRDTCRVCSFICRHILDRIDHGHCSRSIEADEG